MLLSRRQLHALSRDPGVLYRAILIIAGTFFLTALWIGVNRSESAARETPVERRTQHLREMLLADPVDRPALRRWLRGDAGLDGPEREASAAPVGEEEVDPDLPVAGLPSLLAASALPVPEREAFLQWHAALRAGKASPELIGKLEALPMPAAPSLPPTMAADLRRTAGDYAGALAAYEAAGAGPDGAEARRSAVELAMSRDWREVVARLMAQPAYHESLYAFPDGLSRLVAREQLDVPVLFRQSLDSTLRLLEEKDYLLLSVLTAAIWFFSLHKACRLPGRQWWPGVAGIVLGMFSTVITIVLVNLQEARNGLTDSELAGPALLFQIAGVGLREESAKLICCLPLLLFLLKKGTPAQALMAASSVGLGFALKENIGYYRESGVTAVLSRFLTANFLHVGMTGLTGLALFRFLRYPKNYGPAFIATFTCMVLLHGFYNFSASGRAGLFSSELSTLFPFFIAGLAWFYFQIIRQDQDDAPQTLSANAVFLLGTTIIMGTLLNYLVLENGWSLALSLFFPAVLSSVMFCFLFHHFLRDA